MGVFASKIAPLEVATMSSNTASLSVFIEHWNRTHDNLQFAVGANTFRGPADIKVRFNPRKNQRSLVADWGRLNQQLLMNSEQTMLITSDQRQFSHGIINIDVACAHERFSEKVAIDGLEWLGEEFFLNWLWKPKQES